MCIFTIDFENISMGGYCSGGGRGAIKSDEMLSLSVASLKRFGLLRNGANGSVNWSRNGQQTSSIGVSCSGDAVTLNYTNRYYGGDPETIRDHIWLDFTTPNYGGERAWFLCPSCGKRKAVLRSGKYFRCGKCYQMTYASQYEDRASRLLDKAQAIKVKLGGNASCYEPFPPKPKGMHWRTYYAQRAQYDDVYYRANLAIIQQFG